LWCNRRFGALWLGETTSQFGDRITELALPLIAVTMLAATPGQVGVLTALVWLPQLHDMLAGRLPRSAWFAASLDSTNGGRWSLDPRSVDLEDLWLES
jgi:hypothetical protein